MFIDWFNTLSTSHFWQRWETSRPDYIELIRQNLFYNDVNTLVHWMRGDLSAEDITKLLEQRTGIPNRLLFAELRRSSQELTFIDSRVLDLIATIRQSGTQVVIATDNMDTFPRWTTPALNLHQYFDAVLDSFTLKTLKGDVDESGQSKFFKDYLNKHGITIDEAMIFDDTINTVKPLGLDYTQVTTKRPLTLLLEHYIDTHIAGSARS